MPQVVGPENLPSELELTQQRAHLIPENMREKLLCPKPIEFRPVTEKDPYNPQPSDPIKYVWFRADGALPTPRRCTNTCSPTPRTSVC
jgi:acyl-CoA thioesterase-2